MSAPGNRVARTLSAVTTALGSVPAIIASAALILGWLFTGPLFHYSDTWQLIINTSTTIVTFLMVFVIQNTQNRDGRAIQTKLDAIVKAVCDEDDLVGLEDSAEQEIKAQQARVRDV